MKVFSSSNPYSNKLKIAIIYSILIFPIGLWLLVFINSFFSEPGLNSFLLLFFFFSGAIVFGYYAGCYSQYQKEKKLTHTIIFFTFHPLVWITYLLTRYFKKPDKSKI